MFISLRFELLLTFVQTKEGERLVGIAAKRQAVVNVRKLFGLRPSFLSPMAGYPFRPLTTIMSLDEVLVRKSISDELRA